MDYKRLIKAIGIVIVTIVGILTVIGLLAFGWYYYPIATLSFVCFAVISWFIIMSVAIVYDKLEDRSKFDGYTDDDCDDHTN